MLANSVPANGLPAGRGIVWAAGTGPAPSAKPSVRNQPGCWACCPHCRCAGLSPTPPRHVFTQPSSEPPDCQGAATKAIKDGHSFSLVVVDAISIRLKRGQNGEGRRSFVARNEMLRPRDIEA